MLILCLNWVAYLFPQVGAGGWVVLDDIQIPSVHELFQFHAQGSRP